MEINKQAPTVANEPTKFTNEESNELAEIRSGFDKATLAFGQFYLQKREVERVETNLNNELVKLEEQEKAFLDKIVAKYGEGMLDPKTQIFTPKAK